MSITSSVFILPAKIFLPLSPGNSRDARWAWFIALALGLLPVCAGCDRGKAERPADSETIAPLTAVYPVKQSWRIAIEQPGQIEAFEETPIYANISGYVADVCVDMNARVKKGDCLARMWVPEMDEDLKQKTALIVQAKAELELAHKALTAEEATLSTARARVEEARARFQGALASVELWDSQYRRVKDLVTKQVIAEQGRDEMRNQLKTAEAERDEAKAKIDSMVAAVAECEARRDKGKAEVRASEARLRVAGVNEARMTAMLKYSTLTAPFDGVVTVRNVHTGHLLKAGTNDKSAPLFVVVNTDKVRIFVDVPETEAAYVRPGTPARLRLQALKDREIDAKVVRISWVLNPKNRNLRAEIELANPDETLRPGMYADATLFVHHTVWAVPSSAIQRKDDGTFCYLLRNGKAGLLRVRIGARQGSMVELLKKNVPDADAPGVTRWTDVSGDEPIVEDQAAVPALDIVG